MGGMRRALASFLLAVAVLPVAAGPERDAAVVEAVQRGDTAALRDALAALAQAESLDAAAEAFAVAVMALPRNRAFRARFDAALAGATAPGGRGPYYLFVCVPGWLYLSNPESGADLARPRSVLAAFGYDTRLAQIDENGTVEANAAALADELVQLAASGRRIVLVSTSKAGPETHLALDRLERSGDAAHIVGWVNIGGLINGTPRADWWREWPQRLLATVGFAFLGRSADSIESMTTGVRRARVAELRLPRDVLVVNYIGAPRAAEVSARGQDDYAALVAWGPNDGLTLLADALVPQGVTVVEPGLDHFFAAPDLDRRIAALAQAVMGALEEQR